ncbi:MAG: SH3 domain-containing protein [Pyrinomonadaceae bacterium]
MKKCPQCNSVYTFETTYCLNDGALLIDENFSLPTQVSSGEEETVIRSRPATLNPLPPTDSKKPSNLKKYILTLILGLVIGGILVFGAVVFIVSRMKSSDAGKAEGTIQVSNEKHKEKNKTRKDSEFNGFVLSENANLRSSPNSTVFEALPKNDRLSIIERDGVWYRVMCEHGAAGWMHGNTIDWSPGAIPF